MGAGRELAYNYTDQDLSSFYLLHTDLPAV